MKIKQSFIDRCNDITIKELFAIATLSNRMTNGVIQVLLSPYEYEYTPEVLKAAANVLKISLSDIYEVEDLPHSL